MKNTIFILLIVFSFIDCSKNGCGSAMAAPITGSLSIDTNTATKIATGSFTVDVSYTVSGRTTWFKNNTKQIIYTNNFNTSSGHDLKVYLSNDNYASSFINLGNLKGLTSGLEYNFSTIANLSDYQDVLIWCQQF